MSGMPASPHALSGAITRLFNRWDVRYNAGLGKCEGKLHFKKKATVQLGVRKDVGGKYGHFYFSVFTPLDGKRNKRGHVEERKRLGIRNARVRSIFRGKKIDGRKEGGGKEKFWRFTFFALIAPAEMRGKSKKLNRCDLMHKVFGSSALAIRHEGERKIARSNERVFTHSLSSNQKPSREKKMAFRWI